MNRPQLIVEVLNGPLDGAMRRSSRYRTEHRTHLYRERQDIIVTQQARLLEKGDLLKAGDILLSVHEARSSACYTNISKDRGHRIFLYHTIKLQGELRC